MFGKLANEFPFQQYILDLHSWTRQQNFNFFRNSFKAVIYMTFRVGVVAHKPVIKN